MTKTFCDFCETYIPNPTSYNTWFLPIWDTGVAVRGGRGDAVLVKETGIVSEQFCLCDTCIQDMATLTATYKAKRRERIKTSLFFLLIFTYRFCRWNFCDSAGCHII